jgi:hypothetical protein
MLQSAGVIGFGFAATGGIALVGAIIGGIAYSMTKVQEYTVKVYIKKNNVVQPEVDVLYYSNSTLKDVLCQYIPAVGNAAYGI